MLLGGCDLWVVPDNSRRAAPKPETRRERDKPGDIGSSVGDVHDVLQRQSGGVPILFGRCEVPTGHVIRRTISNGLEWVAVHDSV